MFSDKFDLVDALHDYRLAVTIHGDDVLAHHNWEISEDWLRRFKYAIINCLRLPTNTRFSDHCRILVDPATLAITNKWRRDRGEPELHPADYLIDPLPNA